MIDKSFEESRCLEYIRRSSDENPLMLQLESLPTPFSIVLAEGFEERSVGLIECLAENEVSVESVHLGRYTDKIELNSKYRDRFEDVTKSLCGHSPNIVENNNDGSWVRDAIIDSKNQNILLDITGLSNRGLFGALDAVADSGRQVFVGYTEAGEYWPKFNDWIELKKQLSESDTIAELVDKQPWMFGYEHHVELVEGHEGYDSASCRNALIGFLPFKSARLAAILGSEEYSDFLFVAGKPRLPENEWRLQALKEINETITKHWPIVDMSTFGYRNTLQELFDLLFCSDSFLWKYDLHIAIMGSKQQNIASWVLSRIIRSITIVTAVPMVYYPEAFSEGIGASWLIDLHVP